MIFQCFFYLVGGWHTRHYHKLPPSNLPVASKAKPHQAIQPSWEARSTTTEYIILATPWPKGSKKSKMPWSECEFLIGIIPLSKNSFCSSATWFQHTAMGRNQHPSDIRMRSFRCCLKATQNPSFLGYPQIIQIPSKPSNIPWCTIMFLIKAATRCCKQGPYPSSPVYWTKTSKRSQIQHQRFPFRWIVNAGKHRNHHRKPWDLAPLSGSRWSHTSALSCHPRMV